MGVVVTQVGDTSQLVSSINKLPAVHSLLTRTDSTKMTVIEQIDSLSSRIGGTSSTLVIYVFDMTTLPRSINAREQEFACAKRCLPWRRELDLGVSSADTGSTGVRYKNGSYMDKL